MSHVIARIPRRPAIALTGLSTIAALAVCGPSALATDTNLTCKADLTLKETYDSNVYLEDLTPSPAVPDALPAKKDSWVTTLTPRLALDYRICSGFNLGLSYAPDIVVYHNTHSEDYFAHRAGLTLGGKAKDVLWEQANAFTMIDGNHLGPTFGRPQDIPAIGGIPLRDRRDALIYRGNLKLTYAIGKFFVRPFGAAYLHDFRTEQRPADPAHPLRVYENYIDRQDVNGGLDVGYDLGQKTFVVLGYRYGQQDQYKLLGVDSPYDSTYSRVLAGVEGSPASWIKLAVLGGPDIRSFSDRVHQLYPAFDANELLYWIDTTVTLLPTKADTLVLLNRRYEQPAFSSPSVYEDVIYSLTWRHKLSSQFTANAGFQLYIGDWQAPVNREDWIYTPSAGLSYACDKHLSAELAYSYDWVENQTPTSAAGAAYADGREYTRHLLTLGVKYAF